MPQSSSWPSFGYTFVSHILLLWCFNGLEHFILLLPVIFSFSFFLSSLLFFTATYGQFISIYYLINHYLLICSLITLKMYFVYTIISIFYYHWSTVSPQFVLHWEKNYLTFLIDATHCDIELAFDCFVFSFSWLHFAITLRVLKPVLCFHMTSFNYGAKGVRDVDPAGRCH